MSRSLPEKPNLEFLKKEAKELLRSMGQGKLADAQHALANQYGFATWAKLKAHVESLALSPAEALTAAIKDQDTARVRELLNRHAELREKIDAPLANYGFGAHAMFAAVQRGDRAIIDVLLAHGADIHKRTEWWAGGFGLLDDCDPSLVDFLTERGAKIDVFAASRLGMLGKLRELLDETPSLVFARGGDGQTPLHFASTIYIAELLLERGAILDARDIDHESTPAQYMLRVEHKRHYPHDRQDVARFLVSRGCETDILMASALGDLDLVKRHLDENPDSIRMRVNEEWFPKHDPRAGGTIYIWQLGPNRTAHTVARDFGHEEVYRLLVDRTPAELKLAFACELGDELTFREYLAHNPDAANTLTDEDRRKLPDAAQSGNAKAVQLMLEAGWPVDTPGDMGATALHWAGFHGNAEMARQILRFQPSLDLKTHKYPGTPLSWAIFGSGNGWNRDHGDYVGTVRAMLEAGSKIPPGAESLEPSDAVLEILGL